ncbi:MAG TPA: dihydroneopterin aldolase [Acidimicrobiia bacterium]|nr:dihydroneopterin aldolase [Acidimicrobiia bacterium]
MADRIELRGLEVHARHGVYADEQRDGQPFLVDLALTLDLAPPGRTDDLADTVDYGLLAGAVHDVVAGERWDLIERVAARVAEVVLGFDRRIESVSVTIHKPRAPIPHRFEDVAVTIDRTR